MTAPATALRRLSLFLRKKLTVSGIMGHTQGVSRAMRPPKKQAKKMSHNELPLPEPPVIGACPSS